MIKSERKYGQILGIKISGTLKCEVLSEIARKIARREKFFVVTPNPEIILKASHDQNLAKDLNSADISLADGIGLAAAAKYLELPAPKNFLKLPVVFIQGLIVGAAVLINPDWLTKSLAIVKGRGMVAELIKLAETKNWRVFLLGGEEGVAEAAKYNIYHEVASSAYNNYNGYIQTATGPVLDKDATPVTKRDSEIEKEVIDKINQFAPQILFVGFGCPKQEKWAAKWLSKLNIGGAMVVGGTFDYFAGITKLPPKWIENIGLEWLWRAMTKPGHWGRVWRAVVIFPWKVFVSKLASQGETLRS